MATCTVDRCETSAIARDLCVKHYQRWRRTGDATATRSRRLQPPMVRFMAKVDQDGPVPEDRPDLGPCWIWTGGQKGRKADGPSYGRFALSHLVVVAHRWLWEQENGPVPDGLELDHVCRRPECVRPSHLEAVTHAENRARWASTVTSCPAGHAYTPENTYSDGRSRSCRTCRRERAAAKRAS